MINHKLKRHFNRHSSSSDVYYFECEHMSNTPKSAVTIYKRVYPLTVSSESMILV